MFIFKDFLVFIIILYLRLFSLVSNRYNEILYIEYTNILVLYIKYIFFLVDIKIADIYFIKVYYYN